MQLNHTKVHRDLEAPLHRKIRQGIGMLWLELYQELQAYADKRGLPAWKLDKIVKQEILFHVDQDAEGNLLNTKGKPLPPGSLYITKAGILTKWLKPPAPPDEEPEEGYERLPHPDHPTPEYESARFSRWHEVRVRYQEKGRGPTIRWELREVKLPVEFYLERIDGIWYETKYRLLGIWGSTMTQIFQHQLSRSALRRFQLANDRAA